MNDMTLICETCGLLVAPGTGSIYVLDADMAAKCEADREWQEAHPAGSAIDIHELLTMPGEIHWHTSHDACLEDPDQGAYSIRDSRIATWPDLARWTAHLMDKTWFPLSDWDDLLREAAGEIPARRILVAAKEAA